jgi:alanine racemase
MKRLFKTEWNCYIRRNALESQNGINNAVLSMTVIVLIFNPNSIGFSRKSKKYKKKTVILSDIFQSGLPKDELYDKVADLIIAHKIDRVIGIGETISAFKTKFANAVTYKTQLVYN